jgi:hypothetical protein
VCDGHYSPRTLPLDLGGTPTHARALADALAGRGSTSAAGTGVVQAADER